MMAEAMIVNPTAVTPMSVMTVYHYSMTQATLVGVRKISNSSTLASTNRTVLATASKSATMYTGGNIFLLTDMVTVNAQGSRAAVI